MVLTKSTSLPDQKKSLEKAAQSAITGNIMALVGDVASKDVPSSIASTTTSEIGYINVLVANSCTLSPQASVPLMASSTVVNFQKAFRETSLVHYTDTFRLSNLTVAVWYSIAAFWVSWMRGIGRGIWSRSVRPLPQAVLGVLIGWSLVDVRMAEQDSHNAHDETVGNRLP